MPETGGTHKIGGKKKKAGTRLENKGITGEDDIPSASDHKGAGEKGIRVIIDTTNGNRYSSFPGAGEFMSP